VHPLEDLVWSKLSYVMGFLHPHGTPFDPATELAMQKAFFDHMWNMDMCQIIDAIGDHPLPVQPFDVLARQINELNAQHMEELRTFPQVYDREIHGMLDVFINVAVDVVEQMVISEYGPRAPLAPEQRKKQERKLHNLLFAGLKKERTKKALPTLDILATLNASIRCNKKQQLKPNDFLDFQHATAALGYCDAFFTERSLRGQITASHVRLDEKYVCKVIATPEDCCRLPPRLEGRIHGVSMNRSTLRILKKVARRGELSLEQTIRIGHKQGGDHRDQYPLALLLEEHYLGMTINHTPPHGAHEMREFSLAITLHMFLLPGDANNMVSYLGIRSSGSLDPGRERVFLTAKGALYLAEYVEKRMDRIWSIVVGFASGLFVAIGAGQGQGVSVRQPQPNL
jgi:hypothetical protein